jgi:hypothetical protein
MGMGGYERERKEHSKHLKFEKWPAQTTGEALGNVERYHVFSMVTGAFLGVIKWHGAWHKYCFFPEPDTLFDNSCMNIIKEFMEEMMEERRERRRKKNAT